MNLIDNVLRPRLPSPATAITPPELLTGIEESALGLLTPHFAHEYRALPFRVDTATVWVAMDTRPTSALARELRFLVNIGSATVRDLSVTRVDASVLDTGLRRYYPAEAVAGLIPPEHEVLRLFATDLVCEERVTTLRAHQPGDTSVRRLAEGVLLEAIDLEATEVRIEPHLDGTCIRARVDDRWVFVCAPLPRTASSELARAYRGIAGLDGHLRRVAGSLRLKAETRANRVHDVRLQIAVAPSIFGEMTTIRIRKSEKATARVDDLGTNLFVRNALNAAVAAARGLVLVVGPKGSGKSTTLASLLRSCDRERMVVECVDEQLEGPIAGVTHHQVERASGESVASTVRRLLQTTGDVRAVEDIADVDTGRLIAEAALAGRQVFATMVAASASHAIARLVEQGVPSSDLASTLSLVVSQRMAPRNCPNCAVDIGPTSASRAGDRDRFAEPAARETLGCALCGWTGFAGRRPVFEALVVDDSIRVAIATGVPFPRAVGRERDCDETGRVALPPAREHERFDVDAFGQAMRLVEAVGEPGGLGAFRTGLVPRPPETSRPRMLRV